MWKIISCKVQCFVLILQKRQISWVKVEVIWTRKINNHFKNRHFFLFFYKFMKKIKEHHKTCILWMFYRLILFFKLIMVWKIFCASILLAKTHFQSWNQAFLSQLIWLLLWHGYYKDFWYLEHIKITAFLISSGKVRIACDRIERPLTFCDESHCLVSDSAIPVPPGLFPCPLKAKPGGNKYLCSSWLSLV